VWFASDDPIQDIAVVDLGKSYPVSGGPNPKRASTPAVTIDDSSPDWIDDLSITVKNTSEKAIVAIEAMVYILPWETDLYHMKHIVFFHEGQLPDHALHIGGGPSRPQESSMVIDIEPGAAKDIPLKQAFARLSVARPPSGTPIAGLDSIWIQPQRVYFADGTEWEFRTYQKPDLAKPGRYIPITREQWESSGEK
jgi:hypothetical protein